MRHRRTSLWRWTCLEFLKIVNYSSEFKAASALTLTEIPVLETAPNPSPIKGMRPRKEIPMYEYVAALHVHTTFSDGSGTMPEVMAAARKAGLSILMINDHDTLTALTEGYEGYHDGLLVLVGAELSGPHNHYLIFGAQSCPIYDWRHPQKSIDEVRSNGGIGFLAHPCEQGSPLSDGGWAYTWKNWEVYGFDGIEIWNHTSRWKAKAQTTALALFHFLFKTYTLDGPEPEVLARWDRLNQNRRVAGVGGADVHAAKVGGIGPFEVKIFPYEAGFSAITTHLLLGQPLTGDPESDKQAVLTALAQGSSFVAHDRLSPAKGFFFILQKKNGRDIMMGRETRYEPESTLVWRLPRPGRVRIVRDGKSAFEGPSVNGRFTVPGPGVYRLEADRKMPFFGFRPWIFSNPIRVTP